nr:8979_t:CDS:2 [Entrophospora candida]
MTEEKSKAEVRMLQAVQHATIATVTTEQVQQYAISTTTSIRKNFLDDSERKAKRTRFCKDSNDGDEESSNDENDSEIDLFFHSSPSGGISDAPDLFSSEIISDVQNGISSDKNDQTSLPSTQVSDDPVITEHPLQTLQCILKSEENFTDIWNKYLLKIDLHPWRVEHDCQQLCLAEESLLGRLKPILQKAKNDKESLLQKFAQVWIDIGKGGITLFEQYALLVIHIFVSELTSKRNVISHPSTTEAMWSTIMSFVTGKAMRDGDIEYMWGEVELNSTASRKNGGRDILSLSNDGHECFVLEISYALQNQDRRKTAEDFYKLL